MLILEPQLCVGETVLKEHLGLDNLGDNDTDVHQRETDEATSSLLLRVMPAVKMTKIQI